jgi:5'-nucleotidase (lipoprotein e(P4) family)
MAKHNRFCTVLAGAIVAIALLPVTGCGQRTAPPQLPQQSSEARAVPDGIRWVRDSAEFRALVVQTYRDASTGVASAAASRKAGSWAVILDADETVISNLQYQIERAQAGLAYSPESWRAWVARREATPLPGAAAFLARVHELGGYIAIVTNRLQSECADTEAVFKTHKLTYDAMLCRPDNSPSDKNPRFLAVAAGTTVTGGTPREVVAYVGDNILDFPALTQAAKADAGALEGFGVKYFMLPNPMYGSWQ